MLQAAKIGKYKDLSGDLNLVLDTTAHLQGSIGVDGSGGRNVKPDRCMCMIEKGGCVYCIQKMFSRGR